MKFFTKKTFWFKLIVSLGLLFIVLNFGMSNMSDAMSFGAKRTGALIGGKLLEPVVDLLLAIGDAFLSVIQHAIMGTDSSVTIDTARSIVAAIAAAVVAAVLVGMTVASMGGILAALAALKVAIGAVGIINIAAATAVAGGLIYSAAYVCVDGDDLPEITLIPTYSISPEEIFRGEILLFDVNIFNPKEVKVAVYKSTKQVEKDQANNQTEENQNNSKGLGTKTIPGDAIVYWRSTMGKDNGIAAKGELHIVDGNLKNGDEIKYTTNEGEKTYRKGEGNGNEVKLTGVNSFTWKGTTYTAAADATEGYFKDSGHSNSNSASICPYLKYDSTGNIVTGETSTSSGSSNSGSTSTDTDDDSLFDAEAENVEIMTLKQWNCVTKNQPYEDGSMPTTETLEKYSNYKVKYYYYLKDASAEDNEENRIVTSANNSAMELKSTVAKWYYTLRNLAVVSLMIVLLYIGIRILIASVASEKAKYKQMIKDWVVAICLIFVMQYIMIFANNFVDVVIGLFSNVAGQNLHVAIVNNPNEKLVKGLKKVGLGDYVDSDGNLKIETNLMGKVRVLAQQQSGTTLYVGYAMCFLVLVFYTIYFCYVYAKRLLWTMFLTIISPLVAVSYPLDKIGDGKSQAFDLWLKEYIFNLLIQPFHLLIYLVFVSSAFDLAGTNIIYSLIALGFMLPAEKFLRKMFGFDKSTTAGFMGSVAGAAVAMKGLQKAESFGKKALSTPKDKVKFADGKNLEKRGANSGYDNNRLLGEVAGASTAQSGLNENEQRQLRDETYDAMSGNTSPGSSPTNNTSDGSRTIASANEDAYNDTLGAMFGSNERSSQSGSGSGSTGEEQPQIRMSPVNPSTVTLPNGRKIPMSDFESRSFKERVKAGSKDLPKKAALKLTDEKTWRTGGKIARGVAKAGGAIVGAGLGASLGIATGDPSNVFKYGSAGGYALKVGTEGMANRIGEGVVSGAKRVNDGAMNAVYGKDGAEEKKKQIADERFKNDKEMRKKYAEALKVSDKETIDKAMDAAIKYRQYGITDNDLIIKAMKVDGGNVSNWDNAERITAAQFAGTANDQKTYETVMNKMRDLVGTEKAKSIGNKIKIINKDKNIL